MILSKTGPDQHLYHSTASYSPQITQSSTDFTQNCSTLVTATSRSFDPAPCNIEADYPVGSELITAAGEIYTVVRVPDAGGCGTILEVLDIYEKRMAIKVEPYSKAFKNTIETERKVYKNLHSAFKVDKDGELNSVKHFVEIYGSGETHDGRYSYILMPLMGENLEMFKKTEKDINIYTIARIFQQCLLGLMDIHQAGFLHRDIKPRNIMFARPESVDRQVIFIIDFGLSKAIKDVQVEVKSFVGTHDFASLAAHDMWYQSRGDDLFSLWLSIFTLFKPLPWDEIDDKEVTIEAKRKFVKDETERAKYTADLPKQMEEIFVYITSLEFSDIPDYRILHHLLNQMITTHRLPGYPQGLSLHLSPVQWDPLKEYTGPNFGTKSRQHIYYIHLDIHLSLYVNGVVAHYNANDSKIPGYATFTVKPRIAKVAGVQYKVYVRHYQTAVPNSYPDVVYFDDLMFEIASPPTPLPLKCAPPLGEIDVELALIDVVDPDYISEYDFKQIFKRCQFGGYEIVDKKALIDLVREKYGMIVGYDTESESDSE